MSIKNLLCVSSVIVLALAGCQIESNDSDDDAEGSAGAPAEHSGGGAPNDDDDDAPADAGEGNNDEDPVDPDDDEDPVDPDDDEDPVDPDDDEDPVDPGDDEDPVDPDDDEDPVDPDDDEDPVDPGEPPAAARFFLPSENRNTSAPVVEVDARGGTHSLYPAYASGGAFYSYCGPGCDGENDVQGVSFETSGTVHNAMLALDDEGRPRAVFSTMLKVYYASCDSGCGEASGWTVTEIIDHNGDKEISGEALALDPDGRPRFLMHTYRALLGIGQKPPATELVSCDDDCHDPSAWSTVQISNQIWETSDLTYDAEGRAHLATVAQVTEGELAGKKLTAYLRCDADCEDGDNWLGTGLVEAFEDRLSAITTHTAISLDLTRDAAPRVVLLGKTPEAGPAIYYFECDEGCELPDSWAAVMISNNTRLGPGLDLALDAADRPHFVFTLDYNIGLYACSDTHCTPEDATWDLTPVEFSSDLPTDPIILWPNCTVAAWFLHEPSLALGADGTPRITYQASDISGGWDRPNPTKPDCQAGADMTLSRIAFLQ